MAEARTAGSLPVANVQVLAEACNGEVDVLQQVPERYLSKDPSSEEFVASDDGACAILVINLRKLKDPQSSEDRAPAWPRAPLGGRRGSARRLALSAAGRPAEPRAPPGPTHAGRPPAACLRRGGRERERMR